MQLGMLVVRTNAVWLTTKPFKHSQCVFYAITHRELGRIIGTSLVGVLCGLCVVLSVAFFSCSHVCICLSVCL